MTGWLNIKQLEMESAVNWLVDCNFQTACRNIATKMEGLEQDETIRDRVSI